MRFTVPSTANVNISVQKTGAGPPLVLIHGALLDATTSWGRVLPTLAQHFTVYTMDRRGRAPSGDSEQYSFSMEADDIVNVVEAIGQPVTVLGHSYGALSTMEALDRLKTVTQLILYEPPVTLSPAGPPDSEIVLGDMDRALRANDREEIVKVFLCDQCGEPKELVAAFKSSPIWPVVLEVAATLPRESRAVNAYRDWTERLARWKIPTAMLLGSKTIATPLRQGSTFVSQTMPDCRVVILEGQGHAAMLDAPDYFVQKVLEIIKQ